MRPPESFLGQPVRSLQTMLRIIAQADPIHPSLIPDGIYGPETMSAVSAFQRRHGLAVTGITDQATWDTIVAVYEPALVEIDQAQPLEIILDLGQIIRRGQRHPHVYLVQSILTVLSEAYESISRPGLTGVLDEATSQSLSTFQYLCALPVSGELDKQTWKHLALHYPLAVSRENVSKL